MFSDWASSDTEVLITGETVYCSEVSGEEKKEGLGNRSDWEG